MQDIVIAGGGILGTSLTFWIAQNYTGAITLVEADSAVALHTSRRNTGVIHRPFYLNPEKRKIFARCAQVSYTLWKDYARQYQLPWQQLGTIEVAVEKHELKVLDKYMQWSAQNGMQAQEFDFLTPAQVRAIEPRVQCLGALHCKTDTAVNYQQFTQHLYQQAQQFGAQFKFNHDLQTIQVCDGFLRLHFSGKQEPIETRFLVNCAGGRSMDILHAMDLAQDYTDLHFRGEYWQVCAQKKDWVRTNIYSVPRHGELPFLDPHWIVRADGTCEIGPNAVLVAGPDTYKGFCNGFDQVLQKVLEPPMRNKISLFTNKEFLQLAAQEWQSSLSKRQMVQRVKRFIPDIDADDFVQRGVAGVRSSVIDRQGNFLKEALQVQGPMSLHITNYNSPGATGAPAYSAKLMQDLVHCGGLSALKKRTEPLAHLWHYANTLESILA